MRPLLIFIVALVPLALYGWTPYATEVTQEAFPRETDGLDHLLPFSGTQSRDYYVIRYDVDPAMAYQHTHLTLRRDESTGKYFLKAWDTWSDPNHNRPAALTLPPEVTMEVPEELANVVLQMWVNELFEVRYDRKSSLGLDGVDYTFCKLGPRQRLALR
jgi:hypothetical protein